MHISSLNHTKQLKECYENWLEDNMGCLENNFRFSTSVKPVNWQNVKDTEMIFTTWTGPKLFWVGDQCVTQHTTYFMLYMLVPVNIIFFSGGNLALYCGSVDRVSDRCRPSQHYRLCIIGRAVLPAAVHVRVQDCFSFCFILHKKNLQGR